MAPSRRAQGDVSSATYLLTVEFESAVRSHEGEDIELRIGPRGSNVPVSLVRVFEGQVTYVPRDGTLQSTVLITGVAGYTAGEDYARHRKGRSAER